MKLFHRTAFFALAVGLTIGLCDLRSAQAQTPVTAPQIAKNSIVSNGEATVEKPEEKVEKTIESNSNNVNVLHRVGVQTGDTLPLTLNEAIRRALENNNTIEVARDDVRFQETQLRSLLGVYDPVFTVSPTLTRNSTTGSSSTNDFRLNSDVSGLVRRGGGSYRVFFDNVRTENSFSQQQLSSGNTSTGGALYSSESRRRLHAAAAQKFPRSTIRDARSNSATILAANRRRFSPPDD